MQKVMQRQERITPVIRGSSSTSSNEPIFPIPRQCAAILNPLRSYRSSGIPLLNCVSKKQHFLPLWRQRPQRTSRTKRSEQDLMEPSSRPMSLPWWSCHSRYGVEKELAGGPLWALMRPSLSAEQLLSLVPSRSSIQVRPLVNPRSKW
jgi:hypothetical protein